MKWQFIVFAALIFPLKAFDPDPDLVIQGEAKKAQADFKAAIADYTQAIAADPKNVHAYLARASVLSLEGDHKGAIADDTKAIALDPKNAAAYSNRGNARMMQGNLDGAIADYTAAIKLDPHHVRAFINRGNIKNLQKKYGAAIEDYTAAIAIDPKNAVAYYNRGGAERSVWDYTDAISDFSKAIELNPVDVPAYIDRAILEMLRQNWSAASGDLNKCLTLLPVDRQAYPRIYLWVIANQQGKGDQTNHQLENAIKANSATVSDLWGWQIAKFLSTPYFADSANAAEDAFISSATSRQAQKDKGQRAQAYYYIGLKRGLLQDKAGEVEALRQCLKWGSPLLHEYPLAQAELKSIEPVFR